MLKIWILPPYPSAACQPMSSINQITSYISYKFAIILHNLPLAHTILFLAGALQSPAKHHLLPFQCVCVFNAYWRNPFCETLELWVLPHGSSQCRCSEPSWSRRCSDVQKSTQMEKWMPHQSLICGRIKVSREVECVISLSQTLPAPLELRLLLIFQLFKF